MQGFPDLTPGDEKRRQKREARKAAKAKSLPEPEPPTLPEEGDEGDPGDEPRIEIGATDEELDFLQSVIEAEKTGDTADAEDQEGLLRTVVAMKQDPT